MHELILCRERRKEKWQLVSGVVSEVASCVVTSVGLAILIGASGTIGFAFGLHVGMILGVGAAIEMEQKGEEEEVGGGRRSTYGDY